MYIIQIPILEYKKGEHITYRPSFNSQTPIMHGTPNNMCTITIVVYGDIMHYNYNIVYMEILGKHIYDIYVYV